jgi:hypothetical protein
VGNRTALGLLLAIVAGGCSGDEERTDVAERPAPGEPACDVGAVQKRAAHEPRTIVLACGRLADGGEVEIRSSRDAAGPCLAIVGIPGGPRQCGRAPSERDPASRAAIGGPVYAQRMPGGRLELYGETAPRVVRVALRYRLPEGRSIRKAATLIQIADRRALAAAGIDRPFGYFVGFVPPRARDVTAEAQSGSGAVLGVLRFGPVLRSLHPTAFIAEGGG